MSEHVDKEGWDNMLADMDDERLLATMKNHRARSFWNRPGWATSTNVPTIQYVRNWASYARREGRRRGLL